MKQPFREVMMVRKLPLDRMDDWQLLERYRGENSHEAFRHLVMRHRGMVLSSVLKAVRDRHLAEDVTQTVFMLLSRKAPALKPETVIAGWLCNAARLTSRTTLRGMNRREFHERAASRKRPLSLVAHRADDGDESLHKALATLPENDRRALRLRFWEDLPLREVGRRLDVSEHAAEKRVSRAVASLRRRLAAAMVQP